MNLHIRGTAEHIALLSDDAAPLPCLLTRDRHGASPPLPMEATARLHARRSWGRGMGLPARQRPPFQSSWASLPRLYPQDTVAQEPRRPSIPLPCMGGRESGTARGIIAPHNGAAQDACGRRRYLTAPRAPLRMRYDPRRSRCASVLHEHPPRALRLSKYVPSAPLLLPADVPQASTRMLAALRDPAAAATCMAGA